MMEKINKGTNNGVKSTKEGKKEDIKKAEY
jgi:hypothetical protein